MADHVGVYEISGVLMAAPSGSGTSAFARHPEIASASASPDLSAYTSTSSGLTGVVLGVDYSYSHGGVSRPQGNSAYASGGVILTSSGDYNFGFVVTGYSSSQPEVSIENAMQSGSELLEAVDPTSPYFPTQPSRPLFYSKADTLRYSALKHALTASDLFLPLPETAPSQSYELAPLIVMGTPLGYRDAVGYLSTTLSASSSWPATIEVTGWQSVVSSSQSGAFVSAALGNVLFFGTGTDVAYVHSCSVVADTATFYVDASQLPLASQTLSASYPLGTEVQILSWIPVVSPISGVFRNNTAYSPAQVMITSSGGKIRDVRAWVELVHDARLTSSAADQGLQALQVALRSPNVSFRAAHPLWNAPSVGGFRIRPDPQITGSGGRFGSFYQDVPELLRSSYLLWGGHRCDQGVDQSLSESVVSASYHEFDRDVDMRVVFWDGSPVNNPRELTVLYPSASVSSAGIPRPYTDLVTPDVSGGLYQFYQSPTSGAIFGGIFSGSVPAEFGIGSLTCSKFPWMLDDRVLPGAFFGTSYEQNPFGVPPGWLTGPGGSNKGIGPWTVQDVATGGIGQGARLFVRTSTRTVYVCGGQNVTGTADISEQVTVVSYSSGPGVVNLGSPVAGFDVLPRSASLHTVDFFSGSYGERVALIGGITESNSTVPVDFVHVGQFNPDGTIAWTSCSGLLTGVLGHSSFVYSGSVFVVGGSPSGSLTGSRLVQVGAIDTGTGLITGWTSYPTALPSASVSASALLDVHTDLTGTVWPIVHLFLPSGSSGSAPGLAFQTRIVSGNQLLPFWALSSSGEMSLPRAIESNTVFLPQPGPYPAGFSELFTTNLVVNRNITMAVGTNVVAASPAGQPWVAGGMLVGNWSAVAWNGTVFAAVGLNVAATSPNGLSWTSRSIPSGDWRAIVWVGNNFVAVGTGIAATSVDGISWVNRTMYHPAQFDAPTWVALASSGSMLIAAGYDVVGRGFLAKSVNSGTTWSNAQSGTAGAVPFVGAVAHNGSVFAAVGGDQFLLSNRAYTSPDGVFWTEQFVDDIGARINFSDICVSGTTFVAVGSTQGADGVAYTSPDGMAWTARSIPGSIGGFSIAWRNIAFDGSMLLASGDKLSGSGQWVLATSSDGITWSSAFTGSALLSGAPTSLIWRPVGSPSAFYALYSTEVVSSPDGIVWTSRPSLPSGSWAGLAACSTSSVMVAFGSDLLASGDGSGSWTLRSAPSGASFYQECIWTGENFTVVGLGCAAESPDGIVWSNVSTTATGTSWSDLASDLSSTCVLVGSIGFGGNARPDFSRRRLAPVGAVMQSIHDGPQWKTIGYNGSVFSVIECSGTSGSVSGVAGYSLDGTAWAGTSIPVGEWSSVTVSGTAFAAMGLDQLIISSDGVSWSGSTVPPGPWKAVVWDSSSLIAVGTDIAASSVDGGLSWSSIAIPAGGYVALATQGSNIGISATLAPAVHGASLPFDAVDYSLGGDMRAADGVLFGCTPDINHGAGLDLFVAATNVPSPGPNEFSTFGRQVGPANIRPVYPMLDDVHVLKISDPSSVNSGTTLPGIIQGKTIGSRPGLRGTEASGTWTFLFGTAEAPFDSLLGIFATASAGVWARQVRLELITDIGVAPFEFTPSRRRLYARHSNVPSGEGFRRISILSGAAGWDVGLAYAHDLISPEYGRSVSITDATATAPDSFAVQTFITGDLFVRLSGAGVVSPSWFLGGNGFGTPYIPDSSMSLGTGSAVQIDASASTEIFRRTVGVQTIVPNANDLVSFLNRQGYAKTTLQRWEEADQALASGSSSGFFPGI